MGGQTVVTSFPMIENLQKEGGKVNRQSPLENNQTTELPAGPQRRAKKLHCYV